MPTGRNVGAAEAHAIGLVDRLVDAGKAEAAACTLADELVALSGPALTAVLRCVDDADDLPLSVGLAAESARIAELFDVGEAKEGLAAFVGRRAPRYA